MESLHRTQTNGTRSLAPTACAFLLLVVCTPVAHADPNDNAIATRVAATAVARATADRANECVQHPEACPTATPVPTSTPRPTSTPVPTATSTDVPAAPAPTPTPEPVCWRLDETTGEVWFDDEGKPERVSCEPAPVAESEQDAQPPAQAPPETPTPVPATPAPAPATAIAPAVVYVSVPAPPPQVVYVQVTSEPAPTRVIEPTSTRTPTPTATATRTPAPTHTPTQTRTPTALPTAKPSPTPVPEPAPPPAAAGLLRMSMLEVWVLDFSTTPVGMAAQALGVYVLDEARAYVQRPRPVDAGFAPGWVRTFGVLPWLEPLVLPEPERWQAYPPPVPEDAPNLPVHERMEGRRQ